MALIERVSTNHPQWSEDEHHSVERAQTIPGLRISSRITTASLPDYAVYDLPTLLRAEKRNTVTDGESS